MDKISKALEKLFGTERKQAGFLLQKIKSGKWESLEIKKLKGHNDIFRARSGKLRVIFRRDTKGKIYVLALERRSDKTYKF